MMVALCLATLGCGTSGSDDALIDGAELDATTYTAVEPPQPCLFDLRGVDYYVLDSAEGPRPGVNGGAFSNGIGSQSVAVDEQADGSWRTSGSALWTEDAGHPGLMFLAGESAGTIGGIELPPATYTWVRCTTVLAP
jgi:hypothetical protein